jgi:hypothetical protein
MSLDGDYNGYAIDFMQRYEALVLGSNEKMIELGRGTSFFPPHLLDMQLHANFNLAGSRGR